MFRKTSPLVTKNSMQIPVWPCLRKLSFVELAPKYRIGGDSNCVCPASGAESLQGVIEDPGGWTLRHYRGLRGGGAPQA